jgi:DNA-binding XRE family transcriptional regulator
MHKRPTLKNGEAMDRLEFKQLRKRLDKTQKQMAHLLGVSLKAVHSYEQGWRVVPPAVERHLFFLVSRLKPTNGGQPCWQKKDCTQEQRKGCPACEFNGGELCWFINGSICCGRVQKSWEEKMKICRTCEVFISQVSA